MRTIDTRLEKALKEQAKKTFGQALKDIVIKAGKDYYGDPQISVTCSLDFGSDFPLSETMMTNLVKKDMQLKQKFLKAFSDAEEESSLFSTISFAQDKEAA